MHIHIHINIATDVDMGRGTKFNLNSSLTLVFLIWQCPPQQYFVRQQLQFNRNSSRLYTVFL